MKARLLVVAALLGLSLAVDARRAPAQDNPVNIALGKMATFDPAPNYPLCTDPDDKRQLTDGKFSSEGKLATVGNTTSIWVQKGTVGWQWRYPIVSFDLGQVQPISGVMYSTAAGRAGVTFPTNIYVGVSDDGHTWHFAGDLVALSNTHGAPPTTGYTTWRFTTHDLHAHGRYVAFSVLAHACIFCDEIEIYRRDDAWINEPSTGLQFTDMRQFTRTTMVRGDIARRLTSDLNGVRAELASSDLPAARREALAARLDALAPGCELDAIAPIDPSTFRAVVPINDTDRQILAVRGAILAADHPRLVLWHQHRYQWLRLLAMPPRNPAPPVLDITLMKNEYRSDSLLLTNAGATVLPLTVGVAGIPVEALTVSAVPYTDTFQGTPVAAALPVLEAGPAGYAFSIPAGLTTKLWITVDSHLLAPGAYRATLAMHAGDIQRAVPLQVRVSSVAMPTPRLSLGMWDYDDVDQYEGIGKDNRAQATAMMRSHFLDTPWATRNALPTPRASDFDAQNNLIAPLDWKRFDAWIAKWPNGRNHFIAAAVGDSFAGAKLGMPQFDARVGAWARAFLSGLRDRNLAPDRVALSLVDEPRTVAQDAIISGWEHAIKAAAPEVTIFEDPTWRRPDQVADQSAITQADILSPNFSIYCSGGAPVAAYFQARQAAGQKLWFYQCIGPAHLFDPTTYYRLQAWQAFERGALGIESRSFGGTGGSPTSWDEYLNSDDAFTPVFLDKTSVTDGIGLEALREGIEDYEYLALLRDRVAITTDTAWKTRAQALLNQGPITVLGNYSLDYSWKTNPRVDLPDRYRLQALALLEAAR